MKARLAKLRENLDAVSALVQDVELPAGFPSYVVSLTIDPLPEVVVCINCAPNKGGRDQLLALFGEVFGRDGWQRKLSYSNTHFHWLKTIGSVRVKLEHAEGVPLPAETPVRPAEFPILLMAPQEVGV